MPMQASTSLTARFYALASVVIVLLVVTMLGEAFLRTRNRG